MLYPDAALLLLGHGSTLNADSSAPTYQHAEEIRRRGIFAEVHVGFWKEEPNFRQALRQTRCPRIYVVPNFISSGYFTEQVIPRELGLDGPVTKIAEQEIYYCKPVGLSGTMTAILLQRAKQVVADSPEQITSPESTCLFICGHGTSLNDNSTKIIHEQTEIIRAQNIYGDCQPVLMEQRPFVKDWRTLTDCTDVIVVPFFISDGLHSFEDIPVLLGLTHNVKEQTFRNPHRENGRRLWYATAIGTDPSIADAILAQVEEFDAEYLISPESNSSPLDDPAGEYLQRFLQTPSPWVIGQIIIRTRPDGRFEICHVDHGNGYWILLDPVSSLTELRELALRDAQGEYRPLRAAPNLSARRWTMTVTDVAELRKVLEYIYPAEIENWAMWHQRQLPVTPWQETAERQTGRFRVVREIDEAGVKELVAEVCERGCLKRRLWSPVAQAVEAGRNEIPLLCPEACNYLVGKAREKLKGVEEE